MKKGTQIDVQDNPSESSEGWHDQTHGHSLGIDQ
jgi:hypothetical protein